jgi:hypothetical protein
MAKKCCHKYYLLIKIVHVWTSTKPILVFFFINCIHSKVIQHPNKKLFKINYIFIDIKWFKNVFVKVWHSSHNNTKCKYTPKTIQMIMKLPEILNHILNMRWIKSIWKITLMWFHKKTSIRGFLFKQMWVCQKIN